jgi:hypothetical protein
MKDHELATRIILSRQTFHGLAGAFGSGDIAREALPGYRQQILAEIAILRQLSAEHPAKADTLGDLIERYEVLARHMLQRLN